MARRQSQPSWLIAAGILIVGLLSFLSKLSSDPSTQPESDQSVASQEESHRPATFPSDFPYEIQPIPTNKKAIRIASFNIQVFGQSKMSDQHVVKKLAGIIRQFDVIAIQEIRSADQSLLPKFINVVNATGLQYKFLISPRLGRTSSKEQYAFLYRTSSIEPTTDSVYQIYDPQDLIHREPFVASFQTRPADLSKKPFRFTLINIHTDPDEAKWEVAQMALVYQYVVGKQPHEDDVIILGDLNVNAKKLTPLTRIPNLSSLIEAKPTNTRGTKQFDHIIANQNTTTEFTGRSGVFNMQAALKLSQKQALELSDHQPIWAEFSIEEKGNPSMLVRPVSKTVVR